LKIAIRAGFEIMMALCRSVIDGGQISVPLPGAMDELKALSARLAGRKVMLSTAANSKEYLPAKPAPEPTAVR